MIRQGVARTLFQYMICFKEVSPVFASAYGVSCFTYNFSYLNDCALVLDKFAMLGWASGDPMMANTFAKFFDREEATFLFEVIKVLTGEVRKGNQDLYHLNHGEVNLEKSLCDLIEHFIKIHSLNPGANSRFLVEYLSNILSERYIDYFRSTLRQTNFAMLAQSQITPDRILNCVRTYVPFTQTIKCFDLQNYPNGDNRLLQNIRREDLTLYNLKRLVHSTQISQQYGYEKALQFLDPRGDKISIQTEDALKGAIFVSVQAAFEQFFAYFQSIGRPVPSPLELPNAEVRLIVSGAQYQLPGYPANADYSAYMFRSEKDKYLAALSAESRIEIAEMGRIYNEFAMATSARGADGRIDLSSFQVMLSRLYGPRCAARELFYAVDIDRRGLIDFRNFVVTLGQLRYGSLEDKIWVAFRAFNLNNSQSFDQEEMIDLIRSMNSLKGVALSEYDITKMAGAVFAKFDYDRDGRLNYQEFREAMLSNIDSLQPFFTSFSPAYPRA